MFPGRRSAGLPGRRSWGQRREERGEGWPLVQAHSTVARASVASMVTRESKMGARAAVLFVDEAQDLDKAQLDLALLLAGERRDIFLVGDDDQT